MNLYGFKKEKRKKSKAKSQKNVLKYHNDKFHKDITDKEIELIQVKKIKPIDDVDDKKKDINLTIPQLESNENIEKILNKNELNDDDLRETLIYLLNDIKKMKDSQKNLENKIEELIKEKKSKKDNNKNDLNYINKKETDKNNNDLNMSCVIMDSNKLLNNNNNNNFFACDDVKRSIISDYQNVNTSTCAQNLRNEFNRSYIMKNYS